MVLNRDFKEFIALLNVHEVQYIVVGGYAVAFHGGIRVIRKTLIFGFCPILKMQKNCWQHYATLDLRRLI